MRARWPVLLLIVLGACRQAPVPEPAPARLEVPDPAPPPISLWPATLADALRAYEAGRYDDADRILRDHSVRMAGTAEGTESDFWRAMLKSDPGNPGPSTRERIALFDAYIATGPGAPRYAEAVIFRRLLEALDSNRTAVAALRATADTRDRARADEVRKLSEDLERTMAELDRIRRRLSPRPPD